MFVTATLSLPAQSASSASTPPPREKEAAYELSPFTVSTERDYGYVTKQTLIGSRTVKNLIDLPTTVGIINLEQINDLAATEVFDLVRFTVSSATQNAPIGEDLNIRGFRSGPVLRNGAPRRSSKQTHMYDVERIEILKGPGSMLLGLNTAIGGNVNLISRRASATRAGDIQATVSDNGQFRETINLTGPLLQRDDLAINYRITLGAMDGEAYNSLDDQDQKFIGGATTLFFGNQGSLDVEAYVFRDHGYVYPAPAFIDPSKNVVDPATGFIIPTISPYFSRDFSPIRSRDVYWKNNERLAELTYLTKLGNLVDVRAHYVHTYSDDHRRLISGNTIGANGYTLTRADTPGWVNYKSHTFQVDLVNSLEFAKTRFDTMVGVDYLASWRRQADSSRNGLIPSIDVRNPNWAADDAYFALVPANTRDNSQNQKDFSYYVQENVTLWQERIIMTAGVRWIYPGGTDKNYLTNVVTERDDRTLRGHKYGLVLKPAPWASLYFTDVQNGFVQNGFADRNTAGDNLDPLLNQRGWLKEYGLKVDRALNDRVSVNASLVRYETALTNVRARGVLPDGTIGNIQSNRDYSEGWEMDATLRVKFGNGYSDMVITLFDGEGMNASNQAITGFVPQKYSFLGKYTWTDGPLKGFMIGAAAMDQAEKRDAAYLLDFPLIANVFAAYSWKRHWSVSVNLDNVTDKPYIINLYNSGYGGYDYGLSAKATLRYRW
ncbi:MAG: TonB-dependent receptor [Opitutaceae bacterium]|nr:TonB-dependent receptor [Opitutaceae bacterium]